MISNWTSMHDTRLQQLWSDGVVIKSICIDLGCSYQTLRKYRIMLGLPARRHFKRQHTKLLQVMLTNDMYDAAQKTAHTRYRTVAGYVRALIIHDLLSNSFEAAA